jgi:hypothetical protein
MTRPPTIVIVSLCAIAITGLFFAISATVGGSGAAGAMFLSLPLAAFACTKGWRHSRTALFLFSLGAMAPLMVGVVLTWPHVLDAAPYAVAIAALFGGLAGMLAPTSRAWYASLSAHRLLDL